MCETLHLWLADAESTTIAGRELSKTLYTLPIDIYLSGELGAGKTLFTQSLAQELGVREPLSSPTYALEQRYKTHDGTSFLHLDLYRLESHQVREILAASEDHQGIRCIEWAERIPERERNVKPHIDLSFVEKDHGRMLRCAFHDMKLPSREQIEQWRKEVMLPQHITRHCDAVAVLAVRLGEALAERSIPVRLMALRRAGEVHDLLRFLDFRPGSGPVDVQETPEQLRLFEDFRKRYPGLRHEPACAQFLCEHGFPELALIVAVHGLTLPTLERRTVEQKLIFYADKRVMIDTVVTLDERFQDFHKRYGKGPDVAQSTVWYDEAKRVEAELFPGGVPF